MRKRISSDYLSSESVINKFISSYEVSGKQFGIAARNKIKLFDFEGKLINIKSFKIPSLLNQIVYGLFRKSKAKRSYEFAKYLQSLNIHTPKPIAYYEFSFLGFFRNSFYVSEHLDADLTFRDLTTNFKLDNHETILRLFTRFTYDLHQKGVYFLDHSPGNTLIKKTKNGYEFYLVDLNRMLFCAMDYDTRIKNFSKLTFHRSIVEVMSDEYAKCINKDPDQVFELMWQHTQEFHRKFESKKKLKRKLFFWKKPS
jgi:hypothetical protein